MARLERKGVCKQRKKELRTNGLHPHSIALENSHYVPEILDPAKDGAKLSAVDVSIPQFDWSPVYI
jgi:hypothetical protein